MVGDTDPHGRTDGDRDCGTTDSFDDHGVADGSDLVTRTYYRLDGMDDPTFRPTPGFFDRIEEAFTWAYLRSTDETGLPPHVAAALADAKSLTAAEFEERPEADLRTDVLPAFYQRLASFHCTYRH
jgi:hypothetical protein